MPLRKNRVSTAKLDLPGNSCKKQMQVLLKRNTLLLDNQHFKVRIRKTWTTVRAAAMYWQRVKHTCVLAGLEFDSGGWLYSVPWVVVFGLLAGLPALLLPAALPIPLLLLPGFIRSGLLSCVHIHTHIHTHIKPLKTCHNYWEKSSLSFGN